MEDWFKWEGWVEELVDLGKLALWGLGVSAVLGGLLLKGASESMNGKGSNNPDVKFAKVIVWSGAVLLVTMAIVAWFPRN